MKRPTNFQTMIEARRRLEGALRQPQDRSAGLVRDRLVKHHLTGDYASHLRTESVMLIRAALLRSAEDMGQDVATRFSAAIIQGFGLDSHPMALAFAAVLAAGGRAYVTGPVMTGRNSYALIKTEVNGFEVGVSLSGHLYLIDPDQYGAALAKLQC